MAADTDGSGAGLGRCRFCTNPVTQTVVSMKLVQAFYVVGDDNTFPLWTVAPRYAGGLDFSTSQTGAALAMFGATVVFAQLVIYPVLSGWLGARQTHTVLCCIQVGFITFSLSLSLSLSHTHTHTHTHLFAASRCRCSACSPSLRGLTTRGWCASCGP